MTSPCLFAFFRPQPPPQDDLPLTPAAESARQQLSFALEAFHSLSPAHPTSVRDRSFFSALAQALERNMWELTAKDRSCRMLGTLQWFQNNL